MHNRILAIINENEKTFDNVNKMLKTLSDCKCFEQLLVFTKFDKEFALDGNPIQTLKIQEESDTRAKIKNFVMKYMKQNYGQSYVHILEDCIEINKDPTQFINDIENMMEVFDMNSYLGTITDGCNYIYSKYNPRLKITIDDEKYSKFNIKDILFCSHSNVQWTIFNLQKAIDQEIFFNEEYKIDMFWIIEYLAQRRNLIKNSVYFMNQYITCSSEFGVYSRIPEINNDEQNNNQQMAIEDRLFKSKNIDFSPSNSIDQVLETLYAKLNSKI